MELGKSHRLTPGTPVWVWVVRLAKGRWWPGTVERVRTIDGQTRVVVKFECRRVRDRDGTPVMTGIATTAMRYLELRNINAQGLDQPGRRPVSLLERPEEHETPGRHGTDPPTRRFPNDNCQSGGGRGANGTSSVSQDES